MKMDLCLYLTLSILTINKVFHHGSGLSLPSTTVTQHGSEVEKYYNNTHLDLQLQQRQPKEEKERDKPGPNECSSQHFVNCSPLSSCVNVLVAKLKPHNDESNPAHKDNPQKLYETLQDCDQIHDLHTMKAETKLNKFPKMAQTASTERPQKVAETTSREGNSQP